MGHLPCRGLNRGLHYQDLLSTDHPSLMLHFRPLLGGAPCNVATALAKLGVKVIFSTALGRDKMGDQLFELIQGKGVGLCGGGEDLGHDKMVF